MRCPKCHQGELYPGFTALTYNREGSMIQVRVEGIPAEICSACGEAYLSEEVAQQIFDLVDPLLEVGKTLRETILPPPQINIYFPPLAQAHFKQVIAA
ncbi:MAG: hypothetical protein DPW09_26850 [Anaerolineae bacterium]|nr:type II toxin-antitoxin system MqsA family antitoxin [Anaerolineales bacterium]MCQ3977064.1 hypothetical protein [Anaerolineae bacterium]